LFCPLTYREKEKNRTEFSGGFLRINEPEQIKTLFPPSTRDYISSQVISQIHLGLFRYDSKSLSIVSGIADDWDVDNSGQVYTFKLSTKMFFQDDDCFKNGKGRKITAQDVKYAYEYLCTYSPDNKNFFGTVDKILGAKEFYKKSSEGEKDLKLDGIEILNDSTIRIIIEKPYNLFPYNLANPAAAIIAREAFEKYGTKMIVGAGPFYLKSLPENGENILLLRNK